MKIIIITRSMWAGGAERVIAEIVTYLSRNNFEAKIITIDDDIVQYEIPDNVELIAIGKQSNFKLTDKFCRYYKTRKIIKKEKPELVLSMPEDIGIYVIPALYGTKVPVVVSERNNPKVMPWKKSTRLLRKLVYPFVDGIIFQTHEASDFFSDRIRSKSIVLPNPINSKSFPERWCGERRKIIVGAGRLDKQKNFKLLIDAFLRVNRIHSDYKLIIYGEGKERQNLTNYAESVLPEGSYLFPGRSSDLIYEMYQASIFVLSSDFEGMPNVLIEAMSIGLPVVSTDCPAGGPRELIANNKNGILVPVGDEVALSDAIIKVISNLDFAKFIGENAISIKNEYDVEVVGKMWLDYLISKIHLKK